MNVQKRYRPNIPVTSQLFKNLTDESFDYPPGFTPDNRWFRWCPSSPEKIAEAEAKIFKCIESHYTASFVTIDKDCHIRTVIVEPQDPSCTSNIPLVLVHGFLGGIGMFIKNINALSKTRRIFVFDMMGFGRSSRVPVQGSAMEVEEAYVTSIEKWRQKVGIDSFVLLGHSLGGFICSAYALRHPTWIKHLILVDPWGYGVKPEDDRVVWTKNGKNMYAEEFPFHVRLFLYFGMNINALAILRFIGPLGLLAFRKWRPDLEVHFADLVGAGVMYDYIYHCNMQDPTGEDAFRALQGATIWACNPMLKRIGDLSEHVSMTLIYGSRTWADITQGVAVKEQRSQSYCDFQIIEGGGHHVYFDKPEHFNDSVKTICQAIDKGTNQKSL